MGPVWNVSADDRGVVFEGPVGARWLGRFRIFRYEVRCWAGGHIPDIAEAVDSPVRTTEDPRESRRRAEQCCEAVPALTWGRDELRTGEMWNSNSMVAWVLARTGHDMERIGPPRGGRAPGWDAGLRSQTGDSTPRSSGPQSPSTEEAPTDESLPSKSRRTDTPLNPTGCLSSCKRAARSRPQSMSGRMGDADTRLHAVSTTSTMVGDTPGETTQRGHNPLIGQGAVHRVLDEGVVAEPARTAGHSRSPTRARANVRCAPTSRTVRLSHRLGCCPPGGATPRRAGPVRPEHQRPGLGHHRRGVHRSASAPSSASPTAGEQLEGRAHRRRGGGTASFRLRGGARCGRPTDAGRSRCGWRSHRRGLEYAVVEFAPGLGAHDPDAYLGEEGPVR